MLCQFLCFFFHLRHQLTGIFSAESQTGMNKLGIKTSGRNIPFPYVLRFHFNGLCGANPGAIATTFTIQINNIKNTIFERDCIKTTDIITLTALNAEILVNMSQFAAVKIFCNSSVRLCEYVHICGIHITICCNDGVSTKIGKCSSNRGFTCATLA